jgi:hypothetical protein
LHDWTRVDAGIYHDFHVAWVPEIKKVLNGGLLPEGSMRWRSSMPGEPLRMC